MKDLVDKQDFSPGLKVSIGSSMNISMNLNFFSKRKKPACSSPEMELLKLKQSKRFRGVQIHRAGCRASAHLAGRFFSMDQAPRLPLPDCDAKECSCHYLGIVDRRQGFDRRRQPDRRKLLRLKLERRIGRDRRRGDDIWRGVDH